MNLFVRLPLALALAASLACARREAMPGDARPPDPASASAIAETVAQAPAGAPSGAPLTDFSCEIVLDGAPRALKAGGEAFEVAAKITNRSKAGERWLAMRPDRPVPHVVNLGSHWLSPGNVTEGVRAPLGADLEPGNSAALRISISPPPAPGEYQLRIEPVQEAVAWFHDQRGCSATVSVKVTN